jgi:3-methyladenine DNA glycosylase/8-oxoguanine DNA glycosylase
MSANPHIAATAHLAAIDPILAGIIARHGACTLAHERGLFAAVGQAIVSQQISVRAAATILGLTSGHNSACNRATEDGRNPRR